MNTRIKQLALAAFQPINDIASEGIADRHTFDQAWFQLYNQKFAALIVRECGHLMVDIMLHGRPDPEQSYEIMMKHFGVEE